MRKLLFVVLALLLLPACGLTIHPPEYAPTSAAGNECRNQCVSNFLLCLDVMSANDAPTEVCSRGMKAGLDLEHCYENCRQYHGGEFTPYSENWGDPAGRESASDADCGGRQRCANGYCKSRRRR